jgi:hypothetical protein
MEGGREIYTKYWWEIPWKTISQNSDKNMGGFLRTSERKIVMIGAGCNTYLRVGW